MTDTEINSDYYLVDDFLTDEERAIRLKVRAFADGHSFKDAVLIGRDITGISVFT